MKHRVLLPLAIAAVGVVGLVPASAAPKTITKSYALQLLPFPSPVTGTQTCLPAEGQEGVTKHTEVLAAPAAGVLEVEVSGFAGDWDISLFSDKGAGLAAGSGTTTGGGAPAPDSKDTLKYKVKKAQKLSIVTCNFLGSPSASGKYTFTYGK